ncbi:MAG: hypothetical protein ACRDO8_02005, partial [Nocardioidaceae bacterium]
MTDHPTLSDLDAATPFQDRHIGPDAHEQRRMLDALGRDSLDALMQAAVPAGIRSAGPLRL